MRNEIINRRQVGIKICLIKFLSSINSKFHDPHIVWNRSNVTLDENIPAIGGFQTPRGDHLGVVISMVGSIAMNSLRNIG